MGNYVDIGTSRNFSCFLNTILYKKKNHLYHLEMTEGLGCAFPGALKVGSLRFDTKQIQLTMGKQFILNTTELSQGSVEFTGAFTEPQNSAFGIFKSSPSSCRNVRLVFDQNYPRYTGSFCAVSNIFGIHRLVNVSISRNKLSFELRGKIYNRLDASMQCTSYVAKWENQAYDVIGHFEKNNEATDFLSVLRKELEAYALKTISQALRRLRGIEQTVKRARVKMEKAVLINNLAFQKLREFASEHTVIQQHLEMAKQKLKDLEQEVAYFSKAIEQLKFDLESLCLIKLCQEVCQEGIYCSVCYEDVYENSRGMCPATCFRTEQRLIPPYTEVVYCDRESCKRIHSTNGFFKRVFGGFFGGLVKAGLSFGITAVATVFGAPPPVASALGGGITTLLDTGRVDEAICSAVSGFYSAGIGGKNPLTLYKEVKEAGLALARKGMAIKVKKRISCHREQNDGRWKCEKTKVQCSKGRYEYEYEHYPYECKRPCVAETISKTIEKSCCKRVSCASFAVNTTCLAENAICKIARLEALALTKNNSTKRAEIVLRDLLYARSNVSFWSMKMKKSNNILSTQRRWLNMTQQSAHSLEKSYNGTTESKQHIEEILSKPLKIKSLFDEQLSSAVGIQLKAIHFNTKVTGESRNLLLPIDITYVANGTQRQISTVLDFEQFNTSLRIISQEILVDINNNVYRNSRNRRSLDGSSPELDRSLLSLKKYHHYCARFINYREILTNFAISLHNLSSELSIVYKVSSRSNHSIFSTFKFSLNKTIASGFGLTDTNYSRPEYYEDDLEISEALKLEKEEMQRNDESLNSTASLLIDNWFATVEDLFNSSRMNYECSGMNDCIKNILDELEKMFFTAKGTDDHRIQKEIQELEIELDDLSNSINITAYHAGRAASKIFGFLKQITDVDLICAQSPNITEHPKPFVELGIGKALTLYCNSTGTALLYSWEFNGEAMHGQTSNVMMIDATSVTHSGNYTCVVSNHIVKERSTPAVVVIHPPPTIKEQPAEYFAIVLAEDVSLPCKVEENENAISYQWWFRPAKLSSPFKKIANETSSYLNISPMKYEHEGWYFCNVSNEFGATNSRTSFVKALSFTLPVPKAVLLFSLNREKNRNSSFVQFSNSTDYDLISSRIVSHILAKKNSIDGVQVEKLQPVECQLPKKTNNTNSDIPICTWRFQYTGRNMTSNVTIYNAFKNNAGLVINATQELTSVIGRFVNATNNGSLSFSIGDNLYFIESNSVAVQIFSLTCPSSQTLLQEDFKCGKSPTSTFIALFSARNILVNLSQKCL